jgi:hypothetical protein
MALATSTNYYSNAIVGVPQLGSDINLYDIHTTPRFAIGFGFERSDGAKFRYCQFGGASTAGKLVASTVSEMYITAAIATNTGLASSTTTAVAGDPVKPGDKGSHYIEVSLTPANSQTFAGGYLILAGGTGAGRVHRIKNSTATGTPSTGRARIELWEPLSASIDATTDLSLIGNQYADLSPHTTGTDATVVGVTMASPSSTQYAWIQTKGICAILQDVNTTTIGVPVMASTTTAGAITKNVALNSAVTTTAVGGVVSSISYPIIGYVVDPASATGYSVINLSL